MANIIIPYTKPPEDIEINIGGLFTDLDNKEARVEISTSHEGFRIANVDLLPIYQAATITQKQVILQWHKAIVAAAISQELEGSDITINDIPDTLFD